MPEQATALSLSEALDSPGLRQLYEEYCPEIRVLARRLLGPDGDMEDLVQDVFLVAWRRRSTLTRAKARAFLYGTAIKLAAANRRRARIRQLFGLKEATVVEDWRTPERAAEGRESLRHVYGLLDALSEKRRTVFILHELHGMTGRDIAELIGESERTVWSRFYKAKEEFLSALDAAGAIEDLRGEPTATEGTR